MHENLSHWAPHSFGLVPHQSKALCKLHMHENLYYLIVYGVQYRWNIFYL